MLTATRGQLEGSLEPTQPVVSMLRAARRSLTRPLVVTRLARRRISHTPLGAAEPAARTASWLVASAAEDRALPPPAAAAAGELSPDAVLAAVDAANASDAAAAADAAAGAAAAAELGYWPSDAALFAIHAVHANLDLPWWGAIMLVTLGIRGALMPINLGTMRNSARMARMQPELKVLQERMKADPNASDMKRQQMYSKQFNALFAKYECHPFKSLRFPLIQLPVFTSMYFGLNRIADVYPDVSTGGALWFPDLAAPDATMLLPLLAASTFFAMIEVGVDGQQLDANPQMKQMKNVMRALALVMVPATYNFPAAVFVYWCTQNSWSLTQSVLLNHVPGVREALDVPRPPPPPPRAPGELAARDPIEELGTKIKDLLSGRTAEQLRSERLVSAEVLEGKKARGRDPAADGITAKDAETFATVKVFEQRPQKGKEKPKRRRK